MELEYSGPAWYAANRTKANAVITELSRAYGPEAMQGGDMLRRVIDIVDGRTPAPLAITAQSSAQNFVTRRQFEQQYPELYEKNAEALNAVVTQFERAGKSLDVVALAAALVARRT